MQHRLDTLEADSRVASDRGSRPVSSGEDSATDGGSSDGGRSSDGYGAPEYLQVSAASNRHWKAAERENDADQRPRRHSLYGYEPFDLLCSGKHRNGGTLGVVLRYAEPAALYLQTGIEGLRSCLAACDPGDPMCADLEACINTFNGTYGLVNTLRTLMCERAVVLGPGATTADKRRQQWVEGQLDEDDFAAADVAPKIRRLKAQYDYEAGRADLRRAAASGKASGGFTASGDRDEDEPTRSQRRREQRRAQHDHPRDRPTRSERERSQRPRRDARESRRSERPPKQRAAASQASDGEGREGKRRTSAPAQVRGSKPAARTDRGATRQRGGDQQPAAQRDGGRGDRGARGGSQRRAQPSGGRTGRQPKFGSASERSGSDSDDSY